ncbi:MAG: hypothetical protein ABI963_05835 [Rhizomicrobium sp.]
MWFWKMVARAMPFRAVCALAAFAGPPLQAWAQDAEWPPSADDCAIIGVVGKAEFHWGAAKSNTPLGSRSFGVDCDFKGLGLKGVIIAPPDRGPYFKGLRLSFQRPVYAANGQHAAITFGINGNAGPKSYFSTGSTCTVEKRDGKWQFVSCQMRWIT